MSLLILYSLPALFELLNIVLKLLDMLGDAWVVVLFLPQFIAPNTSYQGAEESNDPNESCVDTLLLVYNWDLLNKALQHIFRAESLILIVVRGYC